MYSYVLVCTRMYSYVLVCTRMYSYVLVCTRMYSYVLVCTRMYSYVLVCTRMYSYVLVCTRMYSYVTRMYLCGVLVSILPTHLESASRLNGNTAELEVFLLIQRNALHKIFVTKLSFASNALLVAIYLMFYAVCVMPLQALVFER